MYGSWKASVEWYDKMSQVTVEDVKRVTQKYLVPDRRTIATIERNQ
jgi:predicted Zn-dependent peptidase